MTSPLAAVARALDYPAGGPEVARAAADAVSLAHPAAAARLYRLAARAAEDPAALEEAYVGAFDLAPVASPFVGDQLFGASQARHLFLMKVSAMQREAGFDPAPELPDHLAALLRFLAVAPPSAERDDLLRDGALTAARQMLAALEAAHHPYADALAAAVEVLEACAARAATAPSPAAAAATPRKEALP